MILRNKYISTTIKKVDSIGKNLIVSEIKRTFLSTTSYSICVLEIKTEKS